MKEPPENSTKEITNHNVFTTHKKPHLKTTINICRKGSIVKERCQQLTDIALELFPQRELSDEDLTDLIIMYIGADKETIRAYKGYSGTIRSGRCGDNKIVGLSRKGYLEHLGFMHKISGRSWLIHAQSVLFSQASESSCGISGSNEKISISSSMGGCHSEGSVTSLKDGTRNEPEREEEATDKDRNYSPKISDDDPNLAYLKMLAKPKPKEEVAL